MMTKLSDTQLVILSAATQRPDRGVLPLPASLKGGAAQKVVGSLQAKGLVEEVPTRPGTPIWREAEHGSPTTLVATDFAFQALGVEVERGPPGRAPAASAPAKRRNDNGAAPPARKELREGPATIGAAQAGDRRKASARKHGPKPAAATRVRASSRPRSADAAKPERQPRADTKQALLVAMLQRPAGASLDEIVAATGWQAHTVRGAIAGALKKKLGLTVTSEKVEERGRVYQIPG